MNIEKSISPALNGYFYDEGIQLFCYSVADSTNKRAREYCAEAELSPVPTALFIADAQSEGRGRLGRSFFSPASTGLYMTLLIEAPQNDKFTLITALAAVAVREAVSRIFGVETAIKWVNDLYLGDRKVAGILAESFVAGERRYVALGVGVNLSTEDFPEELCRKAGSLISDGKDAEELEALRYALAFEICRGFLGSLRGEAGAYMEQYRRHSCVIGKQMTFVRDGEERGGVALGITDCGELEVLLSTGERTLLSTGEISVKVNLR